LFFAYLHRVFVGPAVLIALLLCGGYFCVRLRLFWLLHPRRTMRRMFGGGRARGAFRAVCLALAGTLGVGNITGVALALLTGGAGAIFWMLLSAFFAMAVKYAEVVLAMDSRVKRDGAYVGGAPFYMRGVGRWGKLLPAVFSVLCILCSVLQGSVIQGNAAASALSALSGVKPVVFGVLLTCVAAGILLFAGRWISRLTAVVIPLATLMYLVMCGSVIAVNHSALPGACAAIWRGACSVRAGVGGVAGYLLSDAARIGCARGLLSNEAGCGTAPLAHITAEDTTPARQGLWGIFEVFLDTAVVCTLTALACLCACPNLTSSTPTDYINAVFGTFYGSHTPLLVAAVIVSFAFATMLTWAFYGVSCLNTLAGGVGKKWRLVYLLLYCAALIPGAAFSSEAVFSVTDLLLGVMTLCNLFVLTKKADRVVTLSCMEGFLNLNHLNRARGCVPATVRPACRDASDHPRTPAR
jgi:AGCS family alanine or glycine:cation symporter